MRNSSPCSSPACSGLPWFNHSETGIWKLNSGPSCLESSREARTGHLPCPAQEESCRPALAAGQRRSAHIPVPQGHDEASPAVQETSGKEERCCCTGGQPPACCDALLAEQEGDVDEVTTTRWLWEPRRRRESKAAFPGRGGVLRNQGGREQNLDSSPPEGPRLPSASRRNRLSGTGPVLGGDWLCIFHRVCF